MKSLFLKGQILASIFSLLLISCNGGGGGMSAGGGIDGTGIMSAGVVSAFGSIVVNGTEFDTSNAEVIVNGKEKGRGDEVVKEFLQIGMVVTVEGRIRNDGSAVADRVIYSTSVVGPVSGVSGIDPDTNEQNIDVLGQTVVVNFTTKFEETSFGTIEEDDVIEVSGYIDVNGKIRATFIKDITDLNILEFEVTGLVKNLNSDTSTFEINNLTVDYLLIDPSELPVGFKNNSLVEVEGELDDVSGYLIATSIELGNELGGDDGDEFEIMGFVTNVVSAFEFYIGNQLVIADTDTVVVDEPPGGLQPGVKLEAEGSFEGGILYAWEIEFWEPDQIEMEGFVTEVVSETEFTVGNQDVQTVPGTVFENVDPEDIEVGMRIEVKGVPTDPEHSVLEADKVSLEVD
jgi:hypothetical protein